MALIVIICCPFTTVTLFAFVVFVSGVDDELLRINRKPAPSTRVTVIITNQLDDFIVKKFITRIMGQLLQRPREY